MRGAVRLLPALLLALSLALMAGLLAACTTTLTVAVDEVEDFSGYTTWDWLPETAASSETHHPLPPSVRALVERNIERTLRERGFAQSRGYADFFVHTELSIRHRIERTQEPFAPALIDSHNSSASYWVEGSNRVDRSWNDLSLSVHISERRGRTTWIGTLEQSVEAGTPLPFDTAVEALIARFAADRLGSSNSGRAASKLAAAQR